MLWGVIYIVGVVGISTQVVLMFVCLFRDRSSIRFRSICC